MEGELGQHDETWESRLPSERDFDGRLEDIVEECAKGFWKLVQPTKVLTARASNSADMLNAMRKVASKKVVLINEVVRCLQCGANRSAIVMAWNLVFDLFREWVFVSKKKRLAPFNATLTGKHKDYSPVLSYEDFFLVSEFHVLEAAYGGKLIRKQTHQILQNALTDRNHYAHPSSRIATPEIAEGYITNLFNNILLDHRLEILLKRQRKKKV